MLFSCLVPSAVKGGEVREITTQSEIDQHDLEEYACVFRSLDRRANTDEDSDH